MKKILVTGGAGYIGSHTVVELIKNSYEPIIIDNLSNSSENNINGIEKITNSKIRWYNINCINLSDMDKVFKKEKNIAAVMHFAAYKSVEESIINPEKYFNNNITALEVVLSCMEKNNIKNIIFSSSCTVYGSAENIPVNEQTPLKKAESPYGETKQIGEKLVLQEKINSIILRYFNPIGTHHSNLIGDYSKDKPSNLVPILAENAIGKIKTFKVYGKNYNTKDGTCIRDYIHVVDLAKSHVAAIKYLLKNPAKYVFNIGTGIGRSVLEIINDFEKVNNIKLNYSFGKRRQGDIEQIFTKINLAKKILKWEAKESLEEALKSEYDWQINKKNEKKN